MRGPRLALLVLGVVVTIGLIAFTAANWPTDASSNSQSQSDGQSGSSLNPGPSPLGGDCAIPPGMPLVGGESADVVDLGEAAGVRVDGVIYPRPDYEGNPWSQWGQGIALDDGRFFSAIGDHLGIDGNSYLYEYDPDTGTLATVGDVLSYVDHQSGSWGHGKIHGQMVAGACGEIYFTSYWGTSRDIRFDGSYNGEILFRLDPYGRSISSLGTPVEQHGVPSLAGSAARHLVYGEAIDPLPMASDLEEGPFFVYDTVSDRVVFEGPSTPHVGFRNIMVDRDGRAYYSMGSGELAVYDPDTNVITTHPFKMPGNWLRASTVPASDGRVFGVTEEEDAFFVLQPSGEIEPLGKARGYTTSMALHPDGDRFFYIPDAHGGAWESGAPLISVDTRTGEETVVVELNPLAEAKLGVQLGGTYDVVVGPSGDVVYIGMNAGTAGTEDDFGEVVLLVVHLR